MIYTDLYIRARTKGGYEEWVSLDTLNLSGATNGAILVKDDTTITGTKWVPKVIIPFTASALPTISNYQATYGALHGEYPTIECHAMIDSTHGCRRYFPEFTYSGGLIDTIYFDLGDTLTGFIILQ